MMQQETAQTYLETLHTRQLLKLRDQVYRVCHYAITHGYEPVYHISDNLSVRGYEVRRELSKREHIPNKQETKQIRQQNALEKKHR
jgi:hypothetical protein